jgi:hypothetical protein
MSQTIQVLDPTAPDRTQGQQPRRTLASLEGKVAGFIDNSKPNFEYLAADLGELLRSRYGVKSVVTHRKHVASVAASAAVMEDLRARCDFVITGMGD